MSAALRTWTARLLASGRPLTAVVLMSAATLLALAVALRQAELRPFESVVFGDERSPIVTWLLGTLGRERTAIVVYLLERSWSALVLATGLTPLFFWVLGSTAVHAAARLAGARAPFGPLFVLFGHTAALARIPADLATLTVPALGAAVGGLTTLGFAAVAWAALQDHHGLTAQRALSTLAVALVVFYLVPLALVAAAVVAILVAAVVLEYVP